jgi:hypothetical protein
MLKRFIQWFISLFIRPPKIKMERRSATNNISEARKIVEKPYFEEKPKVSKVSDIMRHRNVNKHLRIANATRGREREVHIAKAEKLIARYGFKPLDRTPIYD